MSGVGLRRAAFDIGSNQHKIVIANVEKEGGRILDVLFSRQSPVHLHQGFLEASSRGLKEIPAEILVASFNVLVEFRRVCEEWMVPVDQRAGIGTAVFRRARNGAEYLKKVKSELGIRLHVASQEEEARIGFLTAYALHGKEEDGILSWDAGGGSFQVSDSRGRSFLGPCGDSDMMRILADDVRGVPFVADRSANPVHPEEVECLTKEAKKLIQAELPKSDIVLVSRRLVVSFGYLTSAFRVCTDLTGSTTFTKDAVRAGLGNILGKTDEEVGKTLSETTPHPVQDPYPEVGMVVPKACLVLAAMEALDFASVQYYETNGSCLGLLLYFPIWSAASVAS